MAYSVAVTVDSEIASTETGTESERFVAEVSLQAGASDVSVTLGTLTDPVFVAIEGASGVSFKIESGTDSLGANPCAVIQDADGLGISAVLLSNSDGQEQTVTIVAAE